jgi:serine/threonine protein kinase, bacterial
MQVSARLNNRYEIVRDLGDGGFGKTFLVRDLQMPSARECVVKQLKPLHENAEIYAMVQERFQREAAILEQLGEHDQVPRLYAYFCEADLFYLVEEYVEGDTLTQKVQREGAQSEAIVTAMLVNLLPAIVHVHQQKIVHRDIKPDNILLRKSDQKPVLIDFGAVKETMATVLNAQGDSSRSIVVGTPGYMPSEQMVGRPVYGSDLYSLGLTAIYMLTGKLPQELDTDPQTGAFLWRGYAPQVSAGLAAVLDRAIQISPGSRFGSAQEMFMALNGLAVGVTMPPNEVWAQGQPQYIPQTGTPSATVVSAPPSNYVSAMPTQVAAPQPMSQSYPQPVYAQPPSQVYPASAAGGEWKKAAMTGGIIGLSILVGALVLKTQNQPAPVANSGTANPVPTVVASTPATTAALAPSAPKVETSAPEPQKPAVSAAAAAEAAAGTDATIVGDAGSKNVRSGPGTKYDSPHLAYPGDRVKVLATSRDEGGYTWSKVYFPKSGAEGWVAAQLLRADTGQSAPMESEPEPAKPPKPAPAAETNATIAGESGSKNIRSGPGTTYDSPHMAYPGDRVKIIDSAQDKGGYTWYKVYFPKSGADGWIAAQLVRTD